MLFSYQKQGKATALPFCLYKKRAHSRALLIVNLAAMADVQDEDDNFVVLYFGDDAIVADAVTPLPAAVCRQAFSVLTRVFTAFQVLSDPAVDQSLRLLAEFSQALFCFFCIDDVITHFSPSIFPISSWV